MNNDLIDPNKNKFDEILKNLNLESPVLSTFIVDNEKFNNYYENIFFHDVVPSKTSLFFNIFNTNKPTPSIYYINLIIPSSISDDQYFLRIENISDIVKDERISSINIFNDEIYDFVSHDNRFSNILINPVKFAFSNNVMTVCKNLTTIFFIKNSNSESDTKNRFEYRELKLTEYYKNNRHQFCDNETCESEEKDIDKHILTDEIKKAIVKTFWDSFKRENRFSTEYPTFLFITKSKFYSDAVTFNDKIEYIKILEEPKRENEKMKFLQAQTNLLYFYICLNNEKQIVSCDSHYNNIMILINYTIALIDNKQYLKVNLENSQYIKNDAIDNFITLLTTTYNTINIIESINASTDQQQKTANIIYLLFCEFYANIQRDSVSLKPNSVDELYLIELLKNPFEEDKNNEYNTFNYILSIMPHIHINKTNWIIDDIITKLVNINKRRKIGGGGKKRTKKRNQSNRQRKKQQLLKKRKRSRKLMLWYYIWNKFKNSKNMKIQTFSYFYLV